MELEQSSWAQAYRELWQSPGPNEQRPETEQEPVNGAQIRGALSISSEDEELLLDEQILGNEVFGTARTEEPGDGGQKVDEEYNEFLHSREFRARHPPGQDCQVADF